LGRSTTKMRDDVFSFFRDTYYRWAQPNPIELADLPDERDDEVLPAAMAQEVANVHLVSGRRVPRPSKISIRVRGIA